MSTCYKQKYNTYSNNVTTQTDEVLLNLQKYGEILLSEDGDEFILCCTQCVEIFFDYTRFLKHVELEHNVHLATCDEEEEENTDYAWDAELEPEFTKDTAAQELHLALNGDVQQTAWDSEQADLSDYIETNTNGIYSASMSNETVTTQDYSIEYLVDYCSETEERHDLAGNLQLCEEAQLETACRSNSVIRNKRLLWFFIELYRDQPCLWRTDHEHIADRVKRSAAIEDIAATMHKKFRFQMSHSKVRKTISNMRACYFREYQRRLNSDCPETYKPKLWYYRKLSFIENAGNYDMHDDAGKLDEILAKRRQICNSCQREFRSKHGLAQHQRTNAACKPYQCEVCAKTFFSRANLQAHMASHVPVGERRFSCDFCGLKIALYHNYLVHLRRHTKLFAHYCLICGKGEANSTELKLHMLEHTGERPHCCEVCGATFKLHSSLTRHRQLHET